MKYAKIIVPLSGVACLAGIFTLRRAIWSNDCSTLDNRPAMVATPRAEAVATVSANGVCDIAPGQMLGYQVNVDVNATVHPQGLGIDGAVQSVKRSQSGVLQLRGLSSDDVSGSVVLARLQGAHIDNQAMPAAINNPFLLRIGRNCAIEGFAYQRTTPRSEARAQQGFAHQLMWRMPTAASEAAPADNAIGHYDSTYSKEIAGGQRRVTIAGTRYSQIWGEQPKVVTPTQSDGLVELGTSPWFASLVRREVLAGMSVADSDTTTKVQQVEANASAFAGIANTSDGYIWMNLLPHTNIVARATRPVTESQLRMRDAMKNVKVDEALADHVVRNKTGGNFVELWPPLSLYLEAHPEETQTVVAALIKKTVPSYSQASGWLAVGNARTPEAREALLTVIADANVSTLNRTRAAFAMVDREDLGQDYANLLGSYSRGMNQNSIQGRAFARQSALVLGVFASLRADSHPQIYGSARDNLKSMLQSETSPANMHVIFAAMGALGDTDLIPTALSYLSNANPKVRAGALAIFRRIQPEFTSSDLAAVLRRETDPDVKRVAYEMISRQTVDAQRPFEPVLLAQAAADLPFAKGMLTRRAIIKTLGPATQTFEPGRAALKAQLRQEYDKRTGLYALFTQYLSPQDIAEALEGAQ
jgi:hypothetical protein